MTTPYQWPDWLNHIWAKSAGRGEGGAPENLARHTYTVLERLAETIRLRPALPGRLGLPRLWHCLFWACWLHDAGKAARGFQRRLRSGPRWPYRHEVLSLALLGWIAEAFSQEERVWVAAAVASHHKDAGELQLAYSEMGDPEGETLAELVAELDEATLRGLWRWLAECPASWLEALGLTDAGIEIPALPPQPEAVRAVRENGARGIRTWLNAYRRLVRRLERGDEQALLVAAIALRGHIITADHLASAHAGELPAPRLFVPERLLDRWQLS